MSFTFSMSFEPLFNPDVSDALVDYRFGLWVELEILLGLLAVDVDGFLNHIATAQTLGFLFGQTENGIALQFKLP